MVFKITKKTNVTPKEKPNKYYDTQFFQRSNIIKFTPNQEHMYTENKQIQVRKTARYTHLKSETKVNPKVVLVLHGYGQLSTFFSRKFAEIESNYDFVVAEGLHRFYLSGNAGRVGASWMTKEERLIDISDNHIYLQQLVETLRESYHEVLLLGFSQGGATAARFYTQYKHLFEGLILWASVCPPDLPPNLTVFNQGKNYFVLGTEDPYFPFEKQKEVLTLQQELGFVCVTFAGKHDINAETLQTILVNI